MASWFRRLTEKAIDGLNTSTAGRTYFWFICAHFFQDVDERTIKSFLSLLYLGEAALGSPDDVDQVHDLCRMFSVSFAPKSIVIVDRNGVAKDSDAEDEEEVDTDDEVTALARRKKCSSQIQLTSVLCERLAKPITGTVESTIF